MGLLLDKQNCGMRMRLECRERFSRHWLQRKPLVVDPGMHHGSWVTSVPWCMSGSLNHDGGEKRSRYSRRMRNRQFFYIWQEAHCLHIDAKNIGTYDLCHAIERGNDKIKYVRRSRKLFWRWIRGWIAFYFTFMQISFWLVNECKPGVLYQV